MFGQTCPTGAQLGVTMCRDRLIGLLTERATRTLLYYLSETNQHVYHWLIVYIRDNPIPRVCIHLRERLQCIFCCLHGHSAHDKWLHTCLRGAASPNELSAQRKGFLKCLKQPKPVNGRQKVYMLS